MRGAAAAREAGVCRVCGNYSDKLSTPAPKPSRTQPPLTFATLTAAARQSGGANYEVLSQASRNGSGSIGWPPLYQPGAFQTSRCRWQPSAWPVSPTKPIGWPV